MRLRSPPELRLRPARRSLLAQVAPRQRGPRLPGSRAGFPQRGAFLLQGPERAPPPHGGWLPRPGADDLPRLRVAGGRRALAASRQKARACAPEEAAAAGAAQLPARAPAQGPRQGLAPELLQACRSRDGA